jgi:cytochrome c-type protein NapC
LSREKLLAKRLELAPREWTRMKSNDSLEWRNCREFDSMDFTRQSRLWMVQSFF